MDALRGDTLNARIHRRIIDLDRAGVEVTLWVMEGEVAREVKRRDSSVGSDLEQKRKATDEPMIIGWDLLLSKPRNAYANHGPQSRSFVGQRSS